jgi:hypothetical protein
MPSSMMQIMTITKTIKAHHWDIEVHFGWAKHRISVEWYKLLKEFIV